MNVGAVKGTVLLSAYFGSINNNVNGAINLENHLKIDILIDISYFSQNQKVPSCKTISATQTIKLIRTFLQIKTAVPLIVRTIAISNSPYDANTVSEEFISESL